MLATLFTGGNSRQRSSLNFLVAFVLLVVLPRALSHLQHVDHSGM